MPEKKIKFVEVWPESRTRWYLVNTDDFPAVSSNPTWDSITGKPSVFPSEPHAHDDTMKTDSNGNLLVSLANELVPTDAFERVRVAAPFTQFETQFQYDIQPLVWEQITATGGTITHAPNESMAILSVTAALNSSAALQTFQYHRYIPGRGLEFFMTFVMGAASAGVRKRVGYFDSNNGIFLEQNGTTDIAFVRRTYTSGSPVDNRFKQSEWNLDKLDGFGDSGLSLDLTKAQILVMSAQWLGVGRVQIGFDIGGKIVWVHQFLAANVISTVYTQTMNLPARFEITNTEGVGGGSLRGVCVNLSTSGDPDFENYNTFAAGRTAVVTVGTGAEVGVCAIRPAATFGGITNRMRMILESTQLLAGANPVIVRLLYNASVSGGSWAAVNASSGMEINRTLTGFSGGIPVDLFHVAGSAPSRSAVSRDLDARYPLTLDAAGANPKTFVLVAIAIGGNSDCLGSFNWREIR